MKQVPFWVDDHPRPEGLTTQLPAETDFLVVGSGLTGLSTALRLSVAGKDVAVVDAGEIGGGASAINGGMVSPNVKRGVDEIHRVFGPEVGRAMWESTVRSVELVRDYATRPGVDAITHDAGVAALGRGARARRSFERTVDSYRKTFGAAWQLVDHDHIDSIVGGNRFDVAIYETEGFCVHPARLVFGLAREVQREHVPLVDRCIVTSVEKGRAGFTVETSQGIVRAGDVILATNGYTTRQPSPELARRVIPVGSYIIVTERLGEETAARIFPSGTATYTRKRLLHYMRRTHDDRILLGGRRNLHTGLDLDETAHHLRKTLSVYWPELDDVAVSHVWGGRLAVPFDLTPHIGRVGGMWYALGYAGHGVGLSCQLGHELAGMLLGEDPPSVYSRTPHETRFYHRGGRPWFLTPAAYLHRVLDRMGT